MSPRLHVCVNHHVARSAGECQNKVIRTFDDVDRWLDSRHQPQFIVPTRFRSVSFDSFHIASDYPEHGEILNRTRAFVDAASPTSRRFWERNRTQRGTGMFLVGSPGVGKTHLLAAGYHDAPSQKLFATFDELVAAAGPLGMKRLTHLVSEPTLVCIDEIILEDPGSIVMLVTLLQHMVESGTHVLATANMPPHEASGRGGWMRTFERELGIIASMFEIVRIDGRDRRIEPLASVAEDPPRSGPELAATWDEFALYLNNTHPMHDAGWLQRISTLSISGQIDPPDDKDSSLRFVRFIDRAYDRGVDLRLPDSAASPEDLVDPLGNDRRYAWHVSRGAVAFEMRC